MVVLDTQRLGGVGVIDDDVGVGPGGDNAFARIQPEEASRGCSRHLDPPLDRNVLIDRALKKQIHAVLHSGHAIGDLGEIADTELLLLLEAEGTVVGGHHRKVVHSQTAPQLGLMLLVTKRSGADEVGALEAIEPRTGKVVDRAIQILRAGLGENVLAFITRA